MGKKVTQAMATMGEENGKRANFSVVMNGVSKTSVSGTSLNKAGNTTKKLIVKNFKGKVST